MDYIEYQNSEEGVCPICGEEINYGERDVGDGCVSWFVDCPSCLWEGEEVHSLKFVAMVKTED